MKCPNCQTENPAGAKFCFNCATPLEAARPSIEGERRIVTVLFADVVGSTAMAERLDPETVTEIMDGAFHFLNTAVARYEGTVSRIMGDAILAFFGAPAAHEDDAERAVQAALEIQEAAETYRRKIQRAYGLDFRVRIGINTGLVVIAFVGDQVRTEYTVMGDTVNVAARLQAAAEPGTALISAETYDLVKHVYDVRERGPISLKGKSKPVDTYEIVAPKPERGSGRGLEGITSQLVGRDDELARLRSRLAATRANRGALVTLVGEAGVGKSRLVAELRKAATTPSDEAEQTRWIEGRALSYEQSVAYYPWRELIRESIGARDDDLPAVVREKLARLSESAPEMANGIPFIEALLGIESEASARSLAGIELDDITPYISTAVRDHFRHLSARQPLVLTIDDLHWADQSSLDLIAEIASLTPDHSLMLIAVLRPDRHAPSWSFVERVRDELGERFEEIWLAPLDPEHSSELLGNLLYVEDLPESVRNLILQKSEGNPFFLEEIIRSLIDSGHIVRHNGHWRATREIVDVSLPDTLVGVLAARIDRLPEETRRVAQLASIIGRIFSYRVVKAVCDTAPPAERIADPLSHLARLTYEELVRLRTRLPDPEYIFKHVLTQEAAYNLLLVRTRRDYHRRVGNVLEDLYRDQLDDVDTTLAFHFWHGEDWLRAAKYAMHAGERAQRQLRSLREAHEHFERAYQALERLDDPPEDLYLNTVLVGMRAALKLLPNEEKLNRLERAERIARSLGDKARLAEVLHWIAHIHITSGNASRSMSALVENSRLADELDDERLRLYPAWAMAFDLLNNDPKAAVEKLGQVVAVAERERLHQVESHALGSMAIGFARLGQFSRAHEYLARAFEVAAIADSPVARADAHLIASEAYFAMGDYARGLELGRIGTDLALQTKALDCAGFGYCIVGLHNLELPDVEAALATYEESKRFGNDYRIDQHLLSQVQAGMAIARFRGGQSNSTLEMEEALTSSQAIGDLYTTAIVALALADANVSLRRYDEAAKHLDWAIEYYERTRMYPLWIRALEALVRLHEAKGEPAEAEATRARGREVEAEMRALADIPFEAAKPAAEAASAD
jgi:class 3 adenylate cyclase/tetratricopeptide (TPR) repeat protein